MADRDRDWLDIAFIYNRSRDRLAKIAQALILDDLADAQDYAPDLIVEVAGPEVTRRCGEHFLAFVDYMPLSFTALADDGLRECLVDAGGAIGTLAHRPARRTGGNGQPRRMAVYVEGRDHRLP
ncbi:MAG: hypothetical protein QM661_12445 [Solimonas sp.]